MCVLTLWYGRFSGRIICSLGKLLRIRVLLMVLFSGVLKMDFV
jgi:hypothetical protein